VFHFSSYGCVAVLRSWLGFTEIMSVYDYLVVPKVRSKCGGYLLALAREFDL
jgi:hypothetical protein